MVDWPSLPRRISPADFVNSEVPKLWAVFKDAVPLKPGIDILTEWEFEGTGGGIYSAQVSAAGELTIAAGAADEAIAAFTMDRAAFNALYGAITQRYNTFKRNGELEKWRDYGAKKILSSLGKLSLLQNIALSDPAMVDFRFSDDLGDEHVLTMEIGAPGENSPYITIKYDLMRLLSISRPEDTDIASLMGSQLSISGNTDYVAKILSVISGK